MEWDNQTPENAAIPEPLATNINELSLADAAVFYAQNGWPVFPLAGKIPYKFLTPAKESHGHKDATTNQEHIQIWWKEHPHANIGLSTGAVSGMPFFYVTLPQPGCTKPFIV